MYRILFVCMAVLSLSGCMTELAREKARKYGEIPHYSLDARYVGSAHSSTGQSRTLCLRYTEYSGAYDPNPDKISTSISIDFSKPTQEIVLSSWHLHSNENCSADASTTTFVSVEDLSAKKVGDSIIRSEKLYLLDEHWGTDYYQNSVPERQKFEVELYRYPDKEYEAYLKNRREPPPFVDYKSTELIIDNRALFKPRSRAKQIGYYALVPFAVIGDVILSPIELIVMLGALDLPRQD